MRSHQLSVEQQQFAVITLQKCGDLAVVLSRFTQQLTPLSRSPIAMKRDENSRANSDENVAVESLSIT